MLTFVARRLLRFVLVLLGGLLIVFSLMHAVPGNPWNNYSTQQHIFQNFTMDNPAQIELARRFGVDQPLWRQFLRYTVGDVYENGVFICGAICGNLGPSIQAKGRSVQSILFEAPLGSTFWQSRFGYSLQLVGLAALLAIGFGVPLGILSAVKSRSFPGRLISYAMAWLTAMPNFVLGLLAILVVAVWLRLINVIPDWSMPVYWIIPAGVLAVMPLASITRMTRASLLHILGEDYVRAARAKGLGQVRVTWVHVLRNALAPLITFIGPAIMELFTGLVVVENMFGFPGIGRQYWEAVLELDYPMILGMTAIYAVGMVLTNFLVEIICAGLDPRLRMVKQAGER